MTEPDYGEDVLGLDPREETQPQPQEWTVQYLAENFKLNDPRIFQQLRDAHNAALSNAFGQGYDQGHADATAAEREKVKSAERETSVWMMKAIKHERELAALAKVKE
jgi:hypothetical protein